MSPRPTWPSWRPSPRASATVPFRSDVVVFGEVGLAGEVRATSQAALRVREASQLGFKRCVVPDGNLASTDIPAGMAIAGVRTVGEAIDALM